MSYRQTRFEINDITVEPQGNPVETMAAPLIKQMQDGCIVIGYLEHDQDCPNPCKDSDGVGQVHSLSNKHIDSIGIDEAKELLKDKMCVALSYYEHSLSLWDVCGGERIGSCPDKQWDQVEFAGVWVPDDACREHIQSTAIIECLPEGTKVEYKSVYNPDGTCKTRSPKPGEKSYFNDGTVPDERFNNVITWTLPDGRSKGGYKSFELASRAAARAAGVKLTAKAVAAGVRSAAYKCAKSCCETYTDWVNGNCYGFVIERFTEEGQFEEQIDSCWGFIGDYAQTALKEAFDQVKERELNPQI